MNVKIERFREAVDVNAGAGIGDEKVTWDRVQKTGVKRILRGSSEKARDTLWAPMGPLFRLCLWIQAVNLLYEVSFL